MRLVSFFSSLFRRLRPSTDSSAEALSSGATSGAAGTDRAAAPKHPSQLTLEQLKDLKPEWVIIGLGNPGSKYAGTRHNIGYWPVDELLQEHGAQWIPLHGVPAQVAPVTMASGKASSRFSETPGAKSGNADEKSTERAGEKPATSVLLVRSTTYMNDSGKAVGPIAKTLDLPSERVIVLHDELDIAAGQVRIKAKGGEGGHNGLRSMTEHLGTQLYVRVRIGIGRPPKGTPVIDYVLTAFEPRDTDPEHGWMDTALTDAADAARLIVAHGPDIARNDIHTRHKNS
ncbi:aminoacyl-tRNA hydrolase [Corynebacterium zhongnanshanii]|uniref:aminoacyl-tRNA hydrolase n=1 Tax=Corynebacterium zhongnanshanii TaxID=2768834 RepID=UPI003CC829D6